MMEYGEENYLPMVNTINRLNAYYKQQLAARAARRKAKQEMEKEEPIKLMEVEGKEKQICVFCIYMRKR